MESLHLNAEKRCHAYRIASFHFRVVGGTSGLKTYWPVYVFQNRPAEQSFFKNANFSPRVISRIHDYETRVANFITLSVWGGGAPVPQLVSQDQWNQP